MNDDQPTQPLTDAELDEMRNVISGGSETSNKPDSLRIIGGWLLAEVDRLRAELEGWKDNAEDTLRMYDKLKAESTGTALGHLAKIERLQSQRDALVRKLGLDWGPDEFGDLSAVPNGKGDNDE